MLKLNRKGYITIEVILSSVLAFAVAFFLIDITVKLVNKTDDAYLDTVLMTDKALIIKNIKECIENDIKANGRIEDFYLYEKELEIFFNDGGSSKLKIEVNDNKTNIIYESRDNPLNKYEKELNSNLKDLSIIYGKEDYYAYITIKAINIFSDKNNNINIPIYNG